MIVKCVGCGNRKPENALIAGRCRTCVTTEPEPEVTQPEPEVAVTGEVEVGAEVEVDDPAEDFLKVEPLVGIVEQSHSRVEVAAFADSEDEDVEAEVEVESESNGPDKWLWSNTP